MKTVLRLISVFIILISSGMSSILAQDMPKSYPRVVVRLMVEDEEGNENWFACIVKTEPLTTKKDWVKCEVDIKNLRYRFAIARDADDPSAFFFFAVQLPARPGNPPALVQLSAFFRPPSVDRSGEDQYRLSHHDPYFVMRIIPFVNDVSLQKWLSQHNLKNHKEFSLSAYSEP